LRRYVNENGTKGYIAEGAVRKKESRLKKRACRLSQELHMLHVSTNIHMVIVSKTWW
jgi:hypothetical protein